MQKVSRAKRALAALGIAIPILGVYAPLPVHAQTYVIDDGTAEVSIGQGGGAGGSFIALNSFAVTGGNNTITSISIAFGLGATGLSYTAVLWSDPNGDGNPGDAVVLTTAPGVVSGEGSFHLTLISPTTVLTPNFFVGFVITHPNGAAPGAVDTSAPLFDRSYIKFSSNPNDLSGAFTLENGGLPGNWLIRANAVPEPSAVALGTLGLGGILLLQHRRRKEMGRGVILSSKKR